MSALLPFIVVGIFTGSLYGLAAIGLVLTYRTSGVFNFGHGAIAAGAAFFFYTLHISHGWPWPFAAAVTVAVFGLGIGVLQERLTRGLGNTPSVIAIVGTIGILLTAQGLLYLIYGDITREFPPFLPTAGFTVFDVVITWAQVISVTLATVFALGLYLFLRLSRLGVAMRAVVDNSTLTGLAGESATRIRTAAWVIGSAFAALSGILLAPTLGLDPFLLTMLVVQAFGAAAIGRFSSLPLTYLGGLIVGVIASVATKYFTDPPFSGLPSSVPFLVLMAVLLIVPVRSLPRQIAANRNLAPEPLDLPMGIKFGGAVVLIGAASFVPDIVGTRLPLWTNAMVFVILFGSLALLVGASGQVSACHFAFVALGVTNMAHFSAHMSWLPALLCSGLATAPVGALVAIPALRLSGIYLALVTLGFGVLMQNVMYPTKLMFSTNLRVTSASRPDLWLVGGSSDRSYYYIVLALAVLSCVAITLVYRGRLGRLLRAMAESPTMLSTHGLTVGVCRMLVFSLSAFIAGIAGALYLGQTGSAAGVAFGPIQSLLLLAVLIVSGSRLLTSAVIAALLMAVLPGYATELGLSNFGINRQLLAFGLAAIVATMLQARREVMTAWFGRQFGAHADRVRHGPVTARWSAVRTRPAASRAVPARAGAGAP